MSSQLQGQKRPVAPALLGAAGNWKERPSLVLSSSGAVGTYPFRAHPGSGSWSLSLSHFRLDHSYCGLLSFFCRRHSSSLHRAPSPFSTRYSRPIAFHFDFPLVDPQRRHPNLLAIPERQPDPIFEDSLLQPATRRLSHRQVMRAALTRNTDTHEQ